MLMQSTVEARQSGHDQRAIQADGCAHDNESQGGTSAPAICTRCTDAARYLRRLFVLLGQNSFALFSQYALTVN
jgi:hypothetical protein